MKRKSTFYAIVFFFTFLNISTAGASILVPCTDADGDGFAVEGGECCAVDCDDSDSAINPGAVETCDNGVDDDCDGLIDANEPDCGFYETPFGPEGFTDDEGCPFPAPRWAITDGNGDGYTWEAVTDRDGGDLGNGPFIIVDSDAAGAVDMDERLISPLIDSSASATVLLEFDHYFRPYLGGETADVDVSSNGGGDWQTVATFIAEAGGWDAPDHVQIDISAFTSQFLRVRFRYHDANDDWYWALDNIYVGPPICEDLDGDGYEDEACGGNDCDDGDPMIHPGADEACNGLDDDCDGIVPAEELDDDHDGWAACEGDCDDTDPHQHPGSSELCDNKDNDCDPGTMDGVDEDWVGTPCDGPDIDLCPEGQFYCLSGQHICTDDDDEDLEVCDGLDNDCNPDTVDGAHDGWVGISCDGPDADQCKEGIFSCIEGSQACDDATDDIEEACNGVDDDCDGALPEDEADADGDGAMLCAGDCDDEDAAISPFVTESKAAGNCTDGIDNDCDELIDRKDPDCPKKKKDEGCGCAHFGSGTHPDAPQLALAGLIYLLPFGYVAIRLGRFRRRR